MTALRPPVNWIHVLRKKDAFKGKKDTRICALRRKNGTYVQTAVQRRWVTYVAWAEKLPGPNRIAGGQSRGRVAMTLHVQSGRKQAES